MQFPERKYRYRPDFDKGLLAFKIWEIRNQLEINIEAMIQNAPVSKESMKFFGHPIEMATAHVFDRIDELEKMLEESGVLSKEEETK